METTPSLKKRGDDCLEKFISKEPGAYLAGTDVYGGSCASGKCR